VSASCFTLSMIWFTGIDSIFSRVLSNCASSDKASFSTLRCENKAFESSPIETGRMARVLFCIKSNRFLRAFFGSAIILPKELHASIAVHIRQTTYANLGISDLMPAKRTAFSKPRESGLRLLTSNILLEHLIFLAKFLSLGKTADGHGHGPLTPCRRILR
jgi:hypothetical protein